MTRTLDGTYLIIGGTTKAATTSVYFYLAEHPDICASSMKEPRFFLDEDYPVKSSYRMGREELERYLDFYGHCEDERIRMEATPDYLHSPGTAARIARHLPDGRMVFLLREPVSRLESWFRFARQDGMIARDMDFGAFVRAQRKGEAASSAPQHLRVLEQGRYAGDLERWIRALGRNRVHVVFFEDLVADARSVVADICGCVGLDPAPLAELEYEVHNPTRATRFPGLHAAYKRIRYAVRQFTHDKPRLQGLMRVLRQQFEPLYWNLNRRTSGRVEPSAREQRRLVDYYGDSVETLSGILHRPLPETWRQLYAG